MPKKLDKHRERGYNLSLIHIFTKSDFISLHMPANAQTHHMINRETIALMKDGAGLMTDKCGKRGFGGS